VRPLVRGKPPALPLSLRQPFASRRRRGVNGKCRGTTCGDTRVVQAHLQCADRPGGVQRVPCTTFVFAPTVRFAKTKRRKRQVHGSGLMVH